MTQVANIPAGQANPDTSQVKALQKSCWQAL